jgi:repressor LexA
MARPPKSSANPGPKLEACLPVELAALELETNPRCFALRVRGNAMQGAQIIEGDLVLMEFRPPHHGAIVAALIDGECVLRRYWVGGGQAYLRSEDEEHAELVPAQELVIQGVLRAVVRHVAA